MARTAAPRHSHAAKDAAAVGEKRPLAHASARAVTTGLAAAAALLGPAALAARAAPQLEEALLTTPMAERAATP